MPDTFADQANETTEIVPVINEDGSILIGDRKFDGLEDLTKSYVNGQKHIQTIESENAQQRQELAKAKGVDDVLAKLQEQQRTSEDFETTENQSTTTEQTGVITEDKLDELLDQRLTQREIEARETANVSQAMTKAKEAFGDNYLNLLSQKAAELGMSEKDALAIARRSTSAFTQLFVGEGKRAPSDTSGDINSQSIQAREPEKPNIRVPVGANKETALAAWRAAAPKIE